MAINVLSRSALSSDHRPINGTVNRNRRPVVVVGPAGRRERSPTARLFFALLDLGLDARLQTHAKGA
ncbi:hypothetical protein [Streptomyces sp. NPDC048106]|uniref:hypothetical protein n=1 Tax=Streptomyces sp. NPDC048106 TaxID=3155750 RepID=UPI003456CFE3